MIARANIARPVAGFFDRMTRADTFDACTDFFIFYQVTFLFPSILFYYDSLTSPGANFLPEVWGAWACQYPAVMWATIMWGGAATTIIGLTRPQKPWIVIVGAALQLSHFFALALSALLSGGQEFMAVYQGLHFVPIHAVILVGAYRHGRS